MPMSNWALDTFVAPEMSKFTAASIPDMSETDDQQEHWLANFILNNMLGEVQFVSPIRQQLCNFLRRSHAAFAEYALAREATLAYLASTRQTLRYIDAINHWEAFLAYAWQAFCFLGLGKGFWFKRNDGSVLQRLNALYNRSKHAEKAIERGDFIDESPLCVWLTNSGLASTETSLARVNRLPIPEVIMQSTREAQAISIAIGVVKRSLETDDEVIFKSPYTFGEFVATISLKKDYGNRRSQESRKEGVIKTGPDRFSWRTCRDLGSLAQR